MVQVLVFRIRAALEAASAPRDLVRTVRGRGCRLALDRIEQSKGRLAA